MTIRSLQRRIRKLEGTGRAERDDTLPELVLASYQLADTSSAAERADRLAELDRASLAALAEPTVRPGRQGHLVQLILRSRGQWLASQPHTGGLQ
jgi:hypothetical protein